MRRRPELACRRCPAAPGRSASPALPGNGRPGGWHRLRRLLRGLGEPVARAVRTARIRQASWTLSPDVSSTPMARHLVRAQLNDWGYDGESDIAELLVSELVTNALLHGRGVPVITLSFREGTLRCEVEDENPALLQVREEPDNDEDGRGLLLVDMLSRSWGTDRTRTGRPGKAVWFELPAHPACQAS
ncbi:ATP-binding protein [Streptosporangium sp. NPDC005286]|uniref:ATP-binding protein n=1 Tax=Streptosporangium sp. NPDC005286 TaxID=3154463 RepID=UPI0033AB3C14